jgi:hypothetical protein
LRAGNWHGDCGLIGGGKRNVPPWNNPWRGNRSMSTAGSDLRPDEGGICASATQPAESSCRALVPIETPVQIGSPEIDAPLARGARPSAVFLAHLIAIAERAPQTRQRRRAEAGEASALYAGSVARPTFIGRALRRSL